MAAHRVRLPPSAMSDRFFTSDPLAPGEYVLTGPEVHHVATVRRFSPGDRVSLFNGDGHEYTAELVSADRKHVVLNILAVADADRELAFPLIVASALPKGDRADFLIEKLTELGVTRFVPLITARSVVVPKASGVEKFRRAVIEASKQCGRNRLMEVDPPRKWSDWLGLTDLPVNRFVLHTGCPGVPVAGLAGGGAFAVGPEGGFTAEEVAAAATAGWRAVSLGPRVLRVETAAVAVAAWAALGEPQPPAQ